jgi:autophagy-related protein 2
MAWWQKKLLRYALSRTGLLDDTALNLDNLDITLGKKNVIDLKDVGLNIKRISKLAQLPPDLRVETARVVSLRLTVPANIYQSSIVAEVDGVELGVKLEPQSGKEEVPGRDKSSGARSPVTARSPQHRKVHRRLHSPPPFDPDGLEDEREAYLPTTEQLAKSFLLEEPIQERRQLEASVALNAKGMEESFASSSSESDEMGTGATVGLPGFLAGFLQGIADRMQVSVKNVVATLDTELGGDGEEAIPVTLKLRVGSAALEKTDEGGDERNRRKVILDEISLDLVSDAGIFADLSGLTSPASPILSRQSGTVSPLIRTSTAVSSKAETSDSYQSAQKLENEAAASSSPKSPEAMRASILTADADRFADAGDDEVTPSVAASHSEFDIQPGDDNISWGSRRSQSSAPAEDLWKSMASEDDLPESLLLEKAPTPRERSSRGVSPNMSRNRRNVSPYARSLQSPGSWPTLEEHHDRYPLQPSPGSWPTMDQSQFNMFQSLAPERDETSQATTEGQPIDARMTTSDKPIVDLRPSPSGESPEDLTASRIYTHEEAQSMYMSAMSHGPQMHIPGGWGSEGTPSERSMSPEDVKHSTIIKDTQQSTNLVKPPASAPAWDEDLAYGERPYSTPKAPLSGNVTPRPQSPEPADQDTGVAHGARKDCRQLLHIDTVSLLLPTSTPSPNPSEPETNVDVSVSRSFMPTNMPGTFSAYSDMAASRRKLGSSMAMSRGNNSFASGAAEQAATTKTESVPIGIEVGSINCRIDVSSARLLYRLATECQNLVEPSKAGEAGQAKVSGDRASPRIHPSVSISIESFWLGLTDLSDHPHRRGTPPAAAVSLACNNIDVNSQPNEKEVRIESLKAFVGTSCLLSFDPSLSQSSSVVLDDQVPDIALTLTSKASVTKRPITEIVTETLPARILLDLPAVDEAFGSFGGLSGVLEAGNSMLSESGLASSPTAPSKTAKGVRFEGQPEYIGNEPELKINARFGGMFATLQGTSCHMQLRTSTVKAVYREQGAVATVEQVQLSGPHVPEDDISPIILDLTTVRLEYLLSPQDKDLERLLSLLTPSKDKYDTDDDILIDTLLRQRRKGAVSRIAVGGAKVKCSDLACVDTLSSLSSELTRLSAVTKYLPEDDRPGVLVLLRVKECEARLPVNDRFGMLHVRLGDLHCAQVALPALLALSIGSLHASQGSDIDLVHALVPFSGADNLPMVMARMLGGEVEPTIKVKLFNVAIEYSVPVVLCLTGLDQEADSDKVVAELTKSIANLALSKDSNSDKPPSLPSESSKDRTKNTKINLLVHDLAIGLSPLNLSPKGLLVLADTSFSTTVPPDETLTTTLELRKAGLFLADSATTDDAGANIPTRGAPSNTAVKPKLTTALSKQGYVSVGSIMAARVSVKVVDSAENGAKSVDVDVRNELLLLETCADSTQTLIAVMNGLAPPTPPSKQQKYRTEPMAIEDMMASFTGDAYAKPEQTPHTLFDLEEEPEEEPDMMLDMPGFEEDDDGLLAESEMTSSLYGPVSGMLGGVDKPEDDGGSDEYPETAESLLEDDPFEMTVSPADARFSDSALVRDLDKQCKRTISENTVDLGLYEIEDLGYDALGGNQTALGTRYRFNTPTGSARRQEREKLQKSFPFKLRLRDLHVIWNIYDGYDWQRTRDGITEAVEQVELRAEQRKARRRTSQLQDEDEESVIGDFLFHSIYIGVPSNQDAQELRRQINRNIDDLASETESVPMSGMSRPPAYSTSNRPKTRRRLKLERSKAHKVAFELRGVSADVLVFPPDSTDIVSSVDVRVKNFEIFDNVPTSTWRKFLTHLDKDKEGREMSKPMAHIELLNVRTLENYAASEITMHVSVLPLRLHVDQDALDFITRFFEFKDESTTPSDAASDQPFLQRVEVDTVDLCLDYKPKKVDYVGLRSGHTTEFMNFVILDAANIRLKHAIVYGIKGFEPLHKTLNDVWMPDVKRNQLPTVLAGLAPMRSLVNLGSGVRDVIAIPVREYQKDGRIVRSIQKGAFQFGKTTASELARLGAKVAIGTQNLLQGAEGMLVPASGSPTARHRSWRSSPSDHGWHDVDEEDDSERPAISAYANQPLSVFGGLRSARRYLEHDLLTARDALIAVQGEVMESSSPASAAAAVARHAPTVILRPIIGTSRAVGTALMGVGNAIDRDNLRRVDDVS